MDVAQYRHVVFWLGLAALCSGVPVVLIGGSILAERIEKRREKRNWLTI